MSKDINNESSIIYTNESIDEKNANEIAETETVTAKKDEKYAVKKSKTTLKLPVMKKAKLIAKSGLFLVLNQIKNFRNTNKC